MVRGRPNKYTDIERYILNRCHVKQVQDILKQCVFGSTERELNMLRKIYLNRMRYESNRQQHRIYRTIVKYIRIYIQHMDFITRRQENVEKYGYEREWERYNKDRDKDDYTENVDYDDDTTDLEENEDGYEVDEIDVEVLGKRNPKKELETK